MINPCKWQQLTTFRLLPYLLVSICVWRIIFVNFFNLNYGKRVHWKANWRRCYFGNTLWRDLKWLLFLRKELCCPAAMTRRWALQTPHTLRRITASIMKYLTNWFTVNCKYGAVDGCSANKVIKLSKNNNNFKSEHFGSSKKALFSNCRLCLIKCFGKRQTQLKKLGRGQKLPKVWPDL